MILNTIKIDNIIIPEDRTRKDFGDIDALGQSMLDEGIITPIAVKDNGDNTYTLLGGERRCQACVKVGITDIPVRIYSGDIDDYQMKAIELAENIYRKDFTWEEEVRLKNEVHELYVKKYGARVTTRKGEPEEVGWSLNDTAELLGESKTNIYTDISLAKSLDTIPQLKDCATKGEANKLLKTMTLAMLEQEKARRIKSRGVGSNTKQTLIDNFIICDFFEGSKDIADKSIHICEIDPPYAIDLHKAKKRPDNKANTGTIGYNEVSSDKYVEFLYKTIKTAYRILANDGWLIFWFGQHPWFPVVYEILTKVGFNTRMITGIWSKGVGQTKQPSVYLGNDYEMFFYARKETSTISKQGRGHIFNYKPVPPQSKIHPTERPIELIEDILSTFGWAGCRVCIPFLGSGNTLLAATNLDMDCFGYELTKQYKDRFIINVTENDSPYKTYKGNTNGE